MNIPDYKKLNSDHVKFIEQMKSKLSNNEKYNIYYKALQRYNNLKSRVLGPCLCVVITNIYQETLSKDENKKLSDIYGSYLYGIGSIILIFDDLLKYKPDEFSLGVPWWHLHEIEKRKEVLRSAMKDLQKIPIEI